MAYLKDNIQLMFQTDTLIASLEGLDLQTYMCKKHKWDDNTWRKYSNLYKMYLLEDNSVNTRTKKPKLLYKDNDIVAVINGKYTEKEILDTIENFLVKKGIVIFTRQSTFIMYGKNPYVQYTVKCPNMTVIGHGVFEHTIEQIIKL